MDQKTLANLKPYQIVGLAILLSTAAALTVAFLLGRRSPQELPDSTIEQMAPQPAVGTAAPPDVPHHFSEDLVVPGFTETGAEISHDDETEGGSPEGV